MEYRRKHIQPKIRSLKKRKKLIQRPWFWILLLVLIIMGTAGYFVFFSRELQVTEITIHGNREVKTDDIKNFISLYAGGRIILINNNKLINQILNQFPKIESLVIEKNLPNTIILNIKERDLFAVFCKDKCFNLDKNGIIFGELKDIPKDTFIIRRDINNDEISLGQNVIDKNSMDMIIKIQKNLKDNFQIDVKNVLVSNPFIVTTSENWKIYFDPTADMDLEITKMNLLLKDQIPITTRKNLQYIYLQYKDRAYYK